MLTEARLFTAQIRLSDAINSGNRRAELEAAADIARLEAMLRPLSLQIDMRDAYEQVEATCYVNQPGVMR